MLSFTEINGIGWETLVPIIIPTTITSREISFDNTTTDLITTFRTKTCEQLMCILMLLT